jgi:hypothetical protein
MDMYLVHHPNGDYQTVNKVQVLDPPLGPSETEVTLIYDWSAVPQFIQDRAIKFPPFGPALSPTCCATWPSLPHRRPGPTSPPAAT